MPHNNPSPTPRIALLAAICGAGLALAAPAKADQLNVTNVSVPLYASGINVSYGATTWSGIVAGQIVLYATDTALPTTPAFNVAAWCVDLYHGISLGNNSYAFVVGTAVTTNGNGVAISAATNTKLMTLAAYGNSLLAGANAGSADVASAIQLAIWQTEYSGLTFTASAAVTNYVTTFEAYANTHTLTGASLSPLNGQQQLITNTVAPGGLGGTTTTQAPEPVSAALLSTGLLGLGIVRRRRAR